jgi:UDP-N-acetylglucosamine 2-epimerase (non-hydrolysing)
LLPEVHLIAGTRPEAIKLAPVYRAIQNTGRMHPVLVSSGQHPDMVRQALEAFGLQPYTTLECLRIVGSQSELLTEMLAELNRHFTERPPAAVVVQGDTTTTLAGALTGFWRQAPVVHVEAGLRSGDLTAPFPEEGNRKLVAQVTSLHLAPTELAAMNLLDEGINRDKVLVTGNTVVDAALHVVRQAAIRRYRPRPPGRLILVTTHRRESWGPPLTRILKAVRELVNQYPDVHVIIPAHPNPAVRAQVKTLRDLDRVHVSDPLPYPELMRTLADAYLVLTDSGGIQEEAPSFGVPTLVLRDVTERVESLHAGCAVLVGTDDYRIVSTASRLLDDPEARDAMTAAGNPYGDGRAAERTEQAVAALLGLAKMPDPMPNRRSS